MKPKFNIKASDYAWYNGDYPPSYKNQLIYLRSRIPRSRLVTLTPAGHMGFVERHREVNEAVGGFLTANNK